MLNQPQSIDDIFASFDAHGHRHYGESVTERQHALQCATFAQQAGESSLVVAAALLHDYGHLCHHLGEDIADRGVDARHELLGARLLARLFVDEIVEAARLHVAAKRYLCWKEPLYLDGLSMASRQSLSLQGGPMTYGEARMFESEPHFEMAVRVRRYDDLGKVANMVTADLESFRPLLAAHLRPDSFTQPTGVVG